MQFINADSRGIITGWNAQAERIFGRTRAEVVGQPLDQTIIPEAYRDAHQRGLAHFLSTGEGPVLNQRIEISALRGDGTEFPIELAIVPIKSHDAFLSVRLCVTSPPTSRRKKSACVSATTISFC